VGLFVHIKGIDEDAIAAYLGDSACRWYLLLLPFITAERASTGRGYQAYFEDFVRRLAKKPSGQRRRVRALDADDLARLQESFDARGGDTVGVQIVRSQ